VSATASVVGAIIGELPSSIQDGLGGQIINYSQYYTTQPTGLWATNVIAAALGITFFLIILVARSSSSAGAPENVGDARRMSRPDQGRHEALRRDDRAAGIDLEIEPGEFVSLIGPPAAGSRRCCGSSAT
jgi:hypothetical protein